MNVICWGNFDNNKTHTISAEFHFNYWPRVGYKRKDKKPYLDIGVKISNYENLNELVFWFSKEFEKFNIKNNFQDLGKCISDNRTASLVFNEVLTTSTNAQKAKQTIVTITKSGETFIIYELSEDNIEIKQEFSGLTLHITLTQLLSKEIKTPIYIRFRLKGNFLKEIERKIIVKNKLLQSAFTETSYIDFRFNDIRSCNSSLQEHLGNNNVIEIEKVHFLLMAHSDEEVSASEPITARILETNAWESYLGNKIDHVCVAYHWRFASSNQSSCIIYGRYKVLHCNGWTILLYIAILFILTIIMNLTSSILYQNLHTWFPIIFK